MKRFNKTINIEVSIDAVAQQLLENMNPDFKHRENVVEAIIGTLYNQGEFTCLYNALNGFTNEINFKPGDVVYCNSRERFNKEQSKWVEIGECVVDEIDLYADQKLVVKWKDTEGIVKQSKVCHTDCSKEFPLVTEIYA